MEREYKVEIKKWRVESGEEKVESCQNFFFRQNFCSARNLFFSINFFSAQKKFLQKFFSTRNFSQQFFWSNLFPAFHFCSPEFFSQEIFFPPFFWPEICSLHKHTTGPHHYNRRLQLSARAKAPYGGNFSSRV